MRRDSAAGTEVAAARVGRFAYVMGGFEQSSGATVGVTERYDLRHDRWRRVAPMPMGLNHAAAVAYRGDVYVIGGYRGREHARRRGRDALPLRPGARPLDAAARAPRRAAARSPRA